MLFILVVVVFARAERLRLSGTNVYRTSGYHILIPVSVVLQRIENISTLMLQEISPRLPEWMNNVVDKADLNDMTTSFVCISSFRIKALELH